MNDETYINVRKQKPVTRPNVIAAGKASATLSTSVRGGRLLNAMNDHITDDDVDVI